MSLLKEERISVGHPNCNDEYVFDKARSLGKTDIYYFNDENSYQALFDNDYSPRKTDIFVFAGPNHNSNILLWSAS